MFFHLSVLLFESSSLRRPLTIMVSRKSLARHHHLCKVILQEHLHAVYHLHHTRIGKRYVYASVHFASIPAQQHKYVVNSGMCNLTAAGLVSQTVSLACS